MSLALGPPPAGAVRQGWTAGAGNCLVVIRSSQGTEALSYRLVSAWQQDAGNRQAPSLLPAPCSRPALCSAARRATMVAVPAAWCSVALALLLALHEGEPSGLACCSSPGSVQRCLPPGTAVPHKPAGDIQGGGSPTAVAVTGDSASVEVLLAAASPSHLGC